MLLVVHIGQSKQAIAPTELGALLSFFILCLYFRNVYYTCTGQLLLAEYWRTYHNGRESSDRPRILEHNMHGVFSF